MCLSFPSPALKGELLVTKQQKWTTACVPRGSRQADSKGDMTNNDCTLLETWHWDLRRAVYSSGELSSVAIPEPYGES